MIFVNWGWISLILMILVYEHLYFAKLVLGCLEVHLCTIRSRVVSGFPADFLCFSVLSEQKCNARVVFKANFNFKDATLRANTLWRVSRCAQTLRQL